MTKTKEIPVHHFIGAGKLPWLITGRVPGEEDVAYLVLADDESEAQTTFVSALHENFEVNSEQRNDLIAECAADHIITGTTKLV
jgi:hypothetical protein